MTCPISRRCWRKRGAPTRCSPPSRGAATRGSALTHGLRSQPGRLRRRAARSRRGRCRPASPRARGGADATRFAVYRNNVDVGLTKALAQRFPVAERLVGDEFFAGMARAYVPVQAAASPLMIEYGDDFPDFIAALRAGSGRRLSAPMSPGSRPRWTRGLSRRGCGAARPCGARSGGARRSLAAARLVAASVGSADPLGTIRSASIWARTSRRDGDAAADWRTARLYWSCGRHGCRRCTSCPRRTRLRSRTVRRRHPWRGGRGGAAGERRADSISGRHLSVLFRSALSRAVQSG